MASHIKTGQHIAFLGFGACALASSLWGTGFYFGRLALNEMSVEHMVLYRFLFACVGMLPVLVIHRRSFRLTRSELRTLLTAAAFGIPIQFLLQFEGLAHTTVSHASLMVGAMPVLLAAAAALFAGETLDVLIAKTANSHTRFLLTEFNPSLGNGLGAQYPPTSTLYGGIYGAEMLMRLATCPRMSFAGSYQLVNPSGVDTTNEFWNAVTKAAANGYATNTTSLPFGYFLSAQGAGEAVAYWALNRSTAVYPTTVGTNCPVVPRDTNATLSLPAVYGLACQGGNGKRYVLLTNKGSNSVPVQIMQDDDLLTNQLLETFLFGSDPSVVNSNPPTTNNIAIQTTTVSNPMVIPPYSVVRLEWDVLAVPPPTLAIAVSNQTQKLLWVGMTNVVYNVQSAPTLPGTWTTLGRVPNTTTDFDFTNWSSAAAQFYRLFVP